MTSLNEFLTKLRHETRLLHQQFIVLNASNTLSPTDLTRFYNQLPEIGGNTLCDLAPYYKFMTSKNRQKALSKPELTAEKPIGPTQIYKTESEPPNKQRLYILFSGVGGMFFIPLAMLVSLLPDGPKTVLVIRSKQHDLYRFGVPKLGNSAFEVANTLRANFQTDGFDHVSVLGVSASGFFALAVAEYLKADIGLSFAGIFADSPRSLGRLHDAGIPAFDPVCQCKKHPETRLINVVSTKNEFDCLASLRLQKTRPHLVNYHLVYGTHHNVLKRMAKMGYLPLFMFIALLRNPLPIRLVSLPFFAVAMLFRQLRLLFGLQKVQDWYKESPRR